MATYAARRVLALIPVLLIASIVTFALVDASGSPIDDLLLRQPPVPEATVDAVRADLYLDRPVVERYWLWLTGLGDTRGDIGLLRGRWGPSTRGIDIGAEIADRAVVTLRLVGLATALTIGLALWAGTVSAMRRGSATDRALTALGVVGFATPAFWLAALLKEGAVSFNDAVGVRVLSTVGATSPDHARLGAWGRAADVLGHLALPTLAIVLTGYGILSRYHRAAVLDELPSDFVRMARAKGLRRRRIVWRHVLRRSLVTTTSYAAVLVSGAVTGSIIVEAVFRWRGLGTYLLDAVAATDSFAVMAFVVVAGVAVVTANLAADLLYAVLDPRIRDE